jgi:hypothetical protein
MSLKSFTKLGMAELDRSPDTVINLPYKKINGKINGHFLPRTHPLWPPTETEPSIMEDKKPEPLHNGTQKMAINFFPH